MDTRIEADNPYRYDRYGYAWHYVPADSQSHLDFGCGRGSLLEALKAKRIGRLVGVDISHDAVRRASEQYGEV